MKVGRYRRQRHSTKFMIDLQRRRIGFTKIGRNKSVAYGAVVGGRRWTQGAQAERDTFRIGVVVGRRVVEILALALETISRKIEPDSCRTVEIFKSDSSTLFILASDHPVQERI